PIPTCRITGPKEAFSVFERSRLYSGEIVLVLPHTAAIEGYLSSYVEWAKYGRRGPGPCMRTGHVDIEGNMLLKETIAVPLHAHFGVTGLIQKDDWRDPADFEAVRSALPPADPL